MKNTDVYDPDLNPVLEAATNEELAVLHDILLSKTSEGLSGQDAYEEHYPNHREYADLIAEELRDFGGNTLVNIFRREGPSYREIVCDVADKIDAPHSDDWEVAWIEHAVMARILEKAFEQMSEVEKRAVLEIARHEHGAEANYHKMFEAVFRAGGHRSLQLMELVRDALVENLLGRGLQVAANVVLGRALGVLLGPIGWAVSGFAAVIQIAGPSYKVTLPSVANVAYVRGRLKDEASATVGGEG